MFKKHVSLLLAAGSISAALPGLAVAHGLEIEAAWVTARPTIGMDHTAYLTIANEAFHPEYLYRASTDVARRVEIHRMIGPNTMVPVERVEIPLDDRLDMRQAGYHLMLIGVKRALLPGEEIPIKLVFGDGQSQQTTVQVSTTK